MKINKFISTIIIFIISLVFAFLFLIPKYQSLGELQSTLAQKQAEYDTKSAYYAKISEIVKELDSKKDALEKIDSALPTDSPLSSLVYFFHKEATKDGLQVTSITLSQGSLPADGSTIKDVSFNLHLLGSYQGFKNFLLSLDKSARLFEVDSVSFSSSLLFSDQTPSSAPIYNFSMEVKTHTY